MALPVELRRPLQLAGRTGTRTDVGVDAECVHQVRLPTTVAESAGDSPETYGSARLQTVEMA